VQRYSEGMLPGEKMRQLPADQHFFSGFLQKIQASSEGAGLSNGERELWLHSPGIWGRRGR